MATNNKKGWKPSGNQSQRKKWTREEQQKLEDLLIQGLTGEEITHELKVTYSQLTHQASLGGGLNNYCAEIAAGKDGVDPAMANEWTKPRICKRVLKFLEDFGRNQLTPGQRLSVGALKVLMEKILHTTHKKENLVNPVSIKDRRLIYDMVKQGYDTTAICAHMGKNMEQTKEYIRKFYAQQRKLSPKEIASRIVKHYVTDTDLSDA